MQLVLVHDEQNLLQKFNKKRIIRQFFHLKICLKLNIVLRLIIVQLNCSLATINGPYVYMVPTPAPVGTVMSINCPAGEAWSSAPVNATCTNVSNTGQWIFSTNESCVGKSMTID